MTQKLSKTSIVLLAVLAVLCLALAMLPMGKVNAATTEVGTIDALIEAVGTAAATSTPAEIKLTEDVYYGTEESPKDTALKIPAQMYIEQTGKTHTVPEITIDLNGHTLYMYTNSNGCFGISNSKFTIKNGKIVASSTTYMAIFGEVTEDQAVDVTVQDVEITYTATGGTKTSVLFANNSKVNVSLNGVSYNTNVDIVRTAGTIDYASVFHGETLQDKVNLTNVYNTITLDNNYAESIVIPAGRGLTIDLNGHTLTNEEGKHTVTNYGTLTIKGNGKVDNTSHGCAAVLNKEGGTVTLTGGDYTRSAENGGNNTYYVLQNLGTMTIGVDESSSVKVYAGSEDPSADIKPLYSSLVTTGYYNSADDKYETADPVLTINGGKFYGGQITVKCDEKGTLNVTGGEFFASTDTSNGAHDAIQGWNVVKISGGTFHGLVSSMSYGSGDSLVSGTMTITGGEFDSEVESYHYDTSTGFSDPKDDGLTVSGGTFASPLRSCHLEVDGSSAVLVKTDSGYEVLSPTSAEAAKYVVFVQDGDVRLGYKGEEQALAAMSDKETYILKEDVYYAYATLAEAVQAADSGDTVTLLKDVNVKDNGSSDGALYVTKSITIDGSGGTTAEKKGFAIAGAGNDAKRVIKIQATNGTVEVTLKNLVVESYFGNSGAMPVVTSGGNVTLVLDNVKIVADGGGNSQALTIGGVSQEGEFVNVTITNSELTTNTAGYPIIVFNPVKMTITDSFLSGYTGIYFKGYYKPDGDLTGASGASGSEVSVSGSTVTYAYNVHGQGQNDFGLYVFEDGGITLNVTDSVSAVFSTNGSVQKIVGNNVYPSGTYSPNNVTFTGGEIRLDNSGNTYFESGAAPEGSTLTVGGGTKLNFPLESKYLAEGSSLVFDEEGQITVANQPVIARIDVGDLSYEVGELNDSVLNVLASLAGDVVPKITVLRDCELNLTINSAINLVLGEEYTDAEGENAYAIPKVTGSITVNAGAAGTTISLYSGGTKEDMQSTFNGAITNNSTDLTLLVGRKGTAASCCIVSGTITNNADAVMYIGDGTAAGAGKIEAAIINHGNVTIDVSRGYVYGDVTNSGTLTVTSVTSFGTSGTLNTLENTGSVTLEKGSYYTNFKSTAGTLNLEGTGSNYYGTFDVSDTTVKIQGGVFEKSAESFLNANIDEKAYAITLTVSGNVERYKVVAIADVTMSIVRDGVTYGFTQLAHAINAAKDGETITLNKDVEASGVTINKSVTIDLGGHILTTLGGLWARDMSLYQDPKTVTFKNGTIMGRTPNEDESAQAYALEVGYGFTLVLEGVTVDYSVGDYGIQFATDGVMTGDGTYVATGATATLTNSKVTAGTVGVFLGGLNPANNGDTNGKQVTLKATDSEISGDTYGIVTNGTYTNAEIDLTDTKVTANNGTAIFTAAQNSTTAVSGGEISGLTGIEVRAGSLTITDATITATGEYKVEANRSGTTVTGAAVAVSPHVTYQDVAVTINGGTFAATGTNGKSFAQVNTVKDDEGYQEVEIDLAIKDGEFKNDVTAEDAANFIEKGTFSAPMPQNYLVEGSSVSADGAVVTEAPGATVVQADGTAYSATTLRDALIIAQDGATVTMLQGYTSATSLVVGKAITLDLNGQTITNNGGKFALALTGDGSVLRDSVGGGKIVAEGAAALVLQPLDATDYQGENPNFTVSNVTLQSTNSAKVLDIWYSNVMLEKVTVTGDGRTDGTINGVQVVQKSDVTFKDSTIDVTVNYVHPDNALSGTAILVSDNAKVTLDGTTVNAKNEKETASGEAAQTSALWVQNNSDAVVKNSTVTSTYAGIVILGKSFTGNHDEVMEQILAIKQEDYARLDIIDSVVESQASFAVAGNGTLHGTLINIEGSKITATGGAPAIYHPQYGVLNVGDGTEITGCTGVEMRAGTFNMTGGKIVATGEYEGGYNGNGSTMSGVALALSQHTTNLPLAANISGGELTATSEKGKALMEYDFEADSTGTDGEKAIAITNGTFNGAVESQSVTNYAAGGKFSVLPAENAFIEGFEGMLYDGYYVPVEKNTSDVGALLTAQAQALTSVRTYVASVLNLTLAEVEAMDLAQAQALVAAIEQINNAQSVSAVAVATNNALNAADELKAALDAAAAEEAEQLAQAKTQFVTDLNALAAGDETNAPVVVPTSTLAAIANAKTYEEAKAYYDNAVAEINDVRTFRAEVAAQTATLGELKEYLTQVGDALNAFGGADGTFEKAIAEVNQAIADAQSAMLTAGAEALDDVRTALESKIDQVNVTLQNAVNSLALELATVRQDVADAAAATDGKLDDVIAAVEAAQAAISGGEATISQVAAAVQEVSDALDGAISELNTAIADVNNKLNAYNSTLNSLTGSLTTVGKELRNDVAEIAADLAVLADRIDGAATSDSVTDVASAVRKIASAIAALQQDVDSIANQVSASEAVETQKATAKTEILTWLNDYVDGITGGATAKASVGRLFMATANAATVSDQSDLYTKLEGAFGADNARLVLKYYNEALNAIDSALTVSDVTTAVSTFKAQVASVEAASGNATDLTVVYVLLAVAVVLVIVLLIMVAARKSDKGEAAATAEEPARQTEEAQPEAQPVAQPVEEQPKQPEPPTPEDDDREQVVISANVRTFEEALDELEEDPRKLFDDVLNYALTKPDAVKVQRSNGLVVKQNGKQIVKLTVKRGNPVALFVLENDLLKDFRRNSDTPVKLKVRATEFVLRSEEDLPTAHMMVDLAVDQIQKDVEAAKERRKAARRAKRQAAAEEAAAAEAPASEE